MGPKSPSNRVGHALLTNEHRGTPTTTEPPAADPAGSTRLLIRRALHRAGPRLVEATRRARADQLPDREALTTWAAAYGHDLVAYHRAELAVITAGLPSPGGPDLARAMGVEHDELAAATADAERALRRWADQAGDGRAALAAVRAQLDDLVVHDAHERVALERLAIDRGAAIDPDGHLLHDALARAPLAEPPFLGPLTLADADPVERPALLRALPEPLAARWIAAEAAHAEATRRALGA